jgi:protein-S-isoprenylcysteine O-methyltransferase Ste14
LNPKIIVIISIVYLYGFFEYYLSYRQKQKSKIVSRGDKGSLWVLIISITIGYLLSFYIATTKIGRIYHWNILFAAGILIIIVGLMIRTISIRTLNKYFTYSVTKVKDHAIVEKGLYKNIRHPGYLGQILIFTGISISLSNWISIILMLISIMPGYINRINIEEKFLVELLGNEYCDYQKRTNKLIPGFY